MDYRGRICTLYPVSWQGALIVPTKFPPSLSEQAFQGALVSDLLLAGLDLRQPVAGQPDQAIVIAAWIIRADPGSQLWRWAATGLAGHAVFQVQGQIGCAAGPVASFQAQGVRHWGLYGGQSMTLLSDAARMAGRRAAEQILAMLAAS